jgi:hypothetical protein
MVEASRGVVLFVLAMANGARWKQVHTCHAAKTNRGE